MVDKKLLALEEHIEALRKMSKNGKKPLQKTIGRDTLVPDVMKQIGQIPDYNMPRTLAIKFKGEDAVDAGACTREMFSEFFAQIFDSATSVYFQCEQGEINRGTRPSFLPKAGLIAASATAADELRAIGAVIMKSLLTPEVCMPQCLPPCFFDYLIDPHSAVPEDARKALDALSCFDSKAAKSLRNLLDKIEDAHAWGMTVGDIDDGGHSNEQLTSANLAAAVRAKIVRLLITDREVELDAIREGFTGRINGLARHLDLFHGFELMNYLCGEAKLDSNMVLNQIDFAGSNLSRKSQGYLQQFVREADEKLLKGFMKFVTGMSVMPSQGLRTAIAVERRSGSSDALPEARACFYQLLVPEYRTYEQFAGSLSRAFAYGQVGFGLQ